MVAPLQLDDADAVHLPRGVTPQLRDAEQPSEHRQGLPAALTEDDTPRRPHQPSPGAARQDATDCPHASRAPPMASRPASSDLRRLEHQAASHIQQGQFQQAEHVYRQLIAAGTENHIVYVNLAALCGMRGRFEDVIALLRHAIRLKPDCPEAHGNLGIALKDQGDLEAAISAYRTALRLNSGQPETHYNLGIALKDAGDINAAIASYHKALQLQPDYCEAHFNLGQALLLRGDYKTGWREYEWRTKQPLQQSKLHAHPPCPPWPGEKLEANSQLLLISELGLGDTLQFMRYVPLLRDQGIAVKLCAQPKLHALIKASGIHPAPTTPDEANAITTGHWLPLLSLPRQLAVSPDNPVASEPYIKTKNELIQKWQGILAGEARPIIGICWQGNPDHEIASFKGRSLPLETLAPIAKANEGSLLSLQKGFGSEQLAMCSFRDRFVSCQQLISDRWDFLETAAIIANCDLVISSDTATAHLAGGMGKTTWLLLKTVPEWRWGLEAETSFWYPSMRLFRQSERDNWPAVVQRVAEALQQQADTLAAAGPESARPAALTTAADPARSPRSALHIQAPISLGELVDKITILQIKSQHLGGTARQNVQTELAALESSLQSLELQLDAALLNELRDVNIKLWQIAAAIREKERHQDFKADFIALARSLYQQNDRRAAIKKAINLRYASSLVEEKSYLQD